MDIWLTIYYTLQFLIKLNDDNNNNNSNNNNSNCERRLFLCTVIQLVFLTLFRGAPEFLGAYHVLFSLSLKLF